MDVVSHSGVNKLRMCLIAGFFKGIVAEIKKVTWPTKKQVALNTLSVLAFCLVIGAIIWLSDFGLDALMGLIARLS